MAVHPVPPRIVDAQIAAVLDDFAGRRGQDGHARDRGDRATGGRRAAAGDLPRLVVDPVMVASTGRPLLDDSRHRRLPRPPAPPRTGGDAEPLGGGNPGRNGAPRGVATSTAWLDWPGRSTGSGPMGAGQGGPSPRRARPRRRVPVPGGWPTSSSTDVRSPSSRAPGSATRNNHGTGCTLSAATAARLASGSEVPAAVAEAKRFVHRALAGAAGWELGRGHGPLDPFGWGPRR